jgi:hypothetical protein
MSTVDCCQLWKLSIRKSKFGRKKEKSCTLHVPEMQKVKNSPVLPAAEIQEAARTGTAVCDPRKCLPKTA